MNPSIIQQNGYICLALARESVLPLGLLEKTEENIVKQISQKLFNAAETAEALNADIFSLFPKHKRGRLPEISIEKEVPFLKGYDIFDLQAGGKLKPLETIIPLIGNGNSDVNFESATKLLYTFKDIKQRSVKDEILLEMHLNFNKPKTEAVGFLEKLKKGKLYVVTEVLQVKEFSIKEVADFNVAANISASSIQEFINLNAELELNKKNKRESTYKNDKAVTIALKAFKILYSKDKDEYRLSKTPIERVRGNNSIDGEPIQDSNFILEIN